MASKKLKKILKAVVAGGAGLLAAKALGKRRKSVADTAAGEGRRYTPGAQIPDIHEGLKSNRYKFDIDHLTDPTLAAKGGRIGKKHGGRTGKQFGGGLNRAVARPVGGVGAPVRPLAYKHGGKVKSMGIAKRGGGVAKR